MIQMGPTLTASSNATPGATVTTMAKARQSSVGREGRIPRKAMNGAKGAPHESDAHSQAEASPR